MIKEHQSSRNSDEAYWRKKPVVVRASQWFKMGDHLAVVPYAGNPRYADIDRDAGKPSIHTLEGDIHFVSPGDWIITGVKGEHYACKPDIFAATYEPASTVSERGLRVELEEGFRYWTHEGLVLRVKDGETALEAHGQGGWTPVP